jgi:uncharacterized protein YwgA
MALFLTGNRDQALLAMVIQEARQAADAQGGFVGRTALQKVMYFLKAMGVPMGYRFDIHHYGPFCDEILRDTDWLITDRVIRDRSDNASRYSNYAPGEAITELLSRHKDVTEPYREVVRKVVRALIPLRPERLELIATLDYLYRRKRASGGPGPWKQSVITQFLDLKGDKFSPEGISQSYDAMVEVGLVEP